MPWEPKDAQRHTKMANTPAKKKKWADMADAILKDSGDEAKAIRIANAKMKDRNRG